MLRRFACALSFLFLIQTFTFGQRQMENLTRGTVAVRQPEGVFIGWRLLGTDPEGTEFNVYRLQGEGNKTKVNEQPLAGATNLVDTQAPKEEELQYQVVPVLEGKELQPTAAVEVWQQNYLEFPIQPIEDYRPGDASVADLDGDGQLDVVLHQASRGRDNGSAGVTGTPVLDAYKCDGTHLWRIDLGKNIREGEHYTQFMVYDLDGDGRAEVVCKTADGSVDGKGKVIGDAEKDWRTLSEGSRRHGRILDGPEYLTVFDGLTGEALATVDYIPSRYPINGWGGIGGNAGNDNYGNRCDRFLACVAYLDGERPSVIMCRGVYGRIVMAAWDWRDQQLTVRWVFDTGMSYPPYENASPFAGMGGHSLSVADVDDDGKDEIVYQAMVVDDNGQGLYSSGLRHGDVMYISDLYPDRPGLEVFTVQENEDDAELFQTPGTAMRDARTGEILWSHSPAIDVPSGLVGDIDPRHRGFEAWGGPGGLRGTQGEELGKAPRDTNWSIWWDGDALREFVSLGRPDRSQFRRRRNQDQGREAGNRRPAAEGEAVSREGDRSEVARVTGPREDRDERDTQAPRRAQPNTGDAAAEARNRERFRRFFGPRPTAINKWNWETEEMEQLEEFEGVTFSRGPSIQADLLGDWREELLVCAPDGKSLRLYTTTIPTEIRLPTLLHDPQYRLGLVWQNVVYNRPCLPSYYLGDGMQNPPRPNLHLVGKGEAIRVESSAEE